MATKKRPNFGGGNLLGVPAPLPDDDEPTPPAAKDAPVVSQPATEPAKVVEAPSAPPPSLRAVEASPAASEQSSSREKPPSTLRLNEAAGKALWDAYLAAKQADPFLSYRQYASKIVLAGLGAK